MDKFNGFSNEEKFEALAKGLIYSKEDTDEKIRAQAKEIEQLRKENDKLKESRKLDHNEIKQLRKENKEIGKKVEKLVDTANKVKAGVACRTLVGTVVVATAVNPLLGLGVSVVEFVGVSIWAQAQEDKKFVKERIELCKTLMPKASEKQIKALCDKIDQVAIREVDGIGDSAGSVYYNYESAYRILKKGKDKATKIPGFSEKVLEEITSMPTPRATEEPSTYNQARFMPRSYK